MRSLVVIYGGGAGFGEVRQLGWWVDVSVAIFRIGERKGAGLGGRVGILRWRGVICADFSAFDLNFANLYFI